MTLAERVEVLGRAPLFAGLSRRSLEQIARTMNEFDAPAGRVLIQPQMKGSGMFLIEEGTVAVQAPNGKHRELGPGEVFGELALLSPAAVRTARVHAKTPVRCLTITRADFRKMLVDEPRLAISMLESMAERIGRTA